jgi:hypothetical protein
LVSVAVTVPPGATVVAASVIAGPVMVSVAPADVPPPGAGVLTVMVCVPADPRSAAVSTAVSEVAETYVVVRAEPSTRTTELAVKFVPVAVSTKVSFPTATEVGETLVNVGAGGGAIMVNVTLDDVPPPGVGLNTVIAWVPIDVTSLAGIEALSDVLDPNVVTRSLPSTRTTAPLTKPLPTTVSEKVALPAAMLAGVSDVAAGTGLATVSVALVASLLDPNHRKLHVAPTVVGAVNVSVALVNPLDGGVCELLR